jgi:hypothetical protein
MRVIKNSLADMPGQGKGAREGSAVPFQKRCAEGAPFCFESCGAYPQFEGEALQEAFKITITGCPTVSPFKHYRFTVDNQKSTLPFHRG